MKRNMLEFVLDSNSYVKGGTKEACVKIREFLKNASTDEDEFVITHHSCVTSEEFVSAVKTLMAYAFQKEDEIPKMWHCDNDCCKVSNILCPGECNIDKDAKELCPYFIDEGFI